MLLLSAACGRLRLKEGKKQRVLRIGPRLYVANMAEDNHHNPDFHDLCDDGCELGKEKAIRQAASAV